ncbi:hypothetical protein BDV40DRAFT_275010 [Aspergillus tamarii]|uniref:Uncharacterized protein n=1 Tax=Aspergillus tamarii TaxID=41984 RepID=A0A5N6UJJ8_ASPTM|nr:hypothetical protein BDV40DRAFT_275010 [Aspergillus tamarii]
MQRPRYVLLPYVNPCVPPPDHDNHDSKLMQDNSSLWLCYAFRRLGPSYPSAVRVNAWFL